MTLLYFAWVREQIGRDAEEIALPADVQTVAALLDWLRSRGGGYASALEDMSVIRVAVNQEFAAPGNMRSAISLRICVSLAACA